jgi:hypothetical protein
MASESNNPFTRLKENIMGTEAENKAAEASMGKTRLGKKYLETKDTIKDSIKKDTGETTNPMGDKYKKGGKVAGRLATRGYGMCKGGKAK